MFGAPPPDWYGYAPPPPAVIMPMKPAPPAQHTDPRAQVPPPAHLEGRTVYIAPVRDAKPTVLAGLYCCAPCGVVTLGGHLRPRGYSGDDEQLTRDLQVLIAQQIVIAFSDPTFGVQLYTIRGQK